MRKLTTIAVFCLILLAGNAFSQNRPVKFSSAYTNLNRDCKISRGANGTDDASNCRGIGGYRIHVYAAAAAMFITAITPGKKETISLTSQDVGFNESKMKIEWRLANGKPFAVIMRVPKYDEESPGDGFSPFGKKLGEELIIVGLKGYEEIDFKVDVKTPNANRIARQSADKAYYMHGNQ